MSDPSATGDSRAATAAADPPLESAGNASEVPGIPRGSECGVLRRRSHRELVAVRLADDDRAGSLEPRDDGRVVRRHVALEHPRRRRRRHAAGAQVVLERDRDAEQRRVLPQCEIPVERGGACERLLACHGVEGVQGWIERVDATERVGEDVGGGAGTRPDLFADLADCRASSDDSRHFEKAGVERRVGGGRQHLIAIERRPHLVGAIRFLTSQDVRGGLDVCRVDRQHPGGVFEKLPELAGEQIDFARVELQLGECGYRLDLCSY